MSGFSLDDECALLANRTAYAYLTTTETPMPLAVVTTETVDEFLIGGDEYWEEDFYSGEPPNDTAIALKVKWFRQSAEFCGMLPLASIGIVLNAVAVAIVISEAKLEKSTKYLVVALLACDIVFLSSVVCFVSCREHLETSVTLMFLVYTFHSAARFNSTWMYCLLARDVAISLSRFWQKDARVQSVKTVVWQCVAVLACSVGYHLLLIPPLRLLLHRLLPVFNPCSTPLHYQWDYIKFTGTRLDVINLVHFVVLYVLVMHVIPFYVTGSQAKGILDELQGLASRDILTPAQARLAHTGFMVVAVSIARLFCVIPKMAILLIRAVDYIIMYMLPAFAFYSYGNTFSNVVLVLQTSSHLFVMVLFNKYLQSKIKNWIPSRCVRTQYRHVNTRWQQVRQRLESSRDTEV